MQFRTVSGHWASALAISLAPSVALSQTLPDAGALQQQIDRERQMQMPKRMAPGQPVVPAPMQPVAGIVVTVKQFRFAGNTLMSAEQLAPAVAAFLNRPLDFAQLQAAAAAVADAYRAAGWVVRAYLPAQDIHDGIVTVQIVEAVFGKLKFEGNLPQRVGTPQVEALFASRQAGGDLLDANALDRALLLADDLPGIAVSGTLAAGTQDRETDLVLKMADEPLAVGEVSLDNTGAHSTGQDRLNANLNLNSPLGFGDLLAGNAIHTQGSDYLRLAYTVPVGNDGWRVGLNASHLGYRLIPNAYRALDAQGTSDSAGLEASYPIIRTRLTNLYLNLNADHRRFDNESMHATTTRYRIDSVSIGLAGNHFDNWGGGGANSASLVFVSGQRDNDVGVISQHFSKLRYSLSRQQVITSDLSFFAQLSGQHAGKDLDTSERFYLGGASGVRAYPANEAGGSRGALTNLELRWKLPAGFTLTGFHDYGHISNEAGMSYALQGAGLSLAWQSPVGVNLKATWAHRIGHNPNPVANHDDQDSTGIKNRVWLSASLPF